MSRKVYFNTKTWYAYFEIIFILAYLFPVKIITDLFGLAIDSYIYAFVTIVLTILYFALSIHEVKIQHLLFFCIIVLIVIMQRDFTGFQLMGLILVDIVTDDIDYYSESLKKNHVFEWIGVLGIIIYSLVYFGYLNRFAFLGVAEANISGVGIFLLGAFVRAKSKRMSNVIWLVGVLTLSRNYLLALIVFGGTSWIIKKNIGNKIIKIFTFGKIGIASSAILLMMAKVFQKYFRLGIVSDYVEGGIKRFINIIDVSNYRRFIVNGGTIEIYRLHPHLLMTGIKHSEFSNYYYEVCRIMGADYSNDRPHNFFFSYLQIYGIFSVIIFWFLSKIFIKIVNKNNFPIFMAAMVYAIFLGMGFSGYWLWILVGALIINYSGSAER